MPYYPYTQLISDPTVLFTQDGLRLLERTHLLKAFGKETLTTTEEEWLKGMTGCQTFLEFRTRIFSPHRLISHEHSILLIESVDRGTRRTPAATLTFRALLMNTTGQWVALVHRRLNRNSGVVDHNMLEVRSTFEGQGVASVLVQSHEDAWEAAGYREVTLTAGILDKGSLRFGEDTFQYGQTQRDGRLFWGLQGYDFHRERDRHGIERIQNAAIRELNAAAANGRLPPTYASNIIENIGRLPSWDLLDIADDFGDLIGERVLSGYDWAAVKHLNEHWPGNETAGITRKDHLKAHPFPR